MYLRSFIVRTFGPSSKIVWIPKAWNFSKGELVHIEAKINGKTWHDTSKVKAGSTGAVYVTIPHFWPVEKGDIIELGIVYATQPINYNSPDPTPKESGKDDGKDAYPGTVD